MSGQIASQNIECLSHPMYMSVPAMPYIFALAGQIFNTALSMAWRTRKSLLGNVISKSLYSLSAADQQSYP